MGPLLLLMDDVVVIDVEGNSRWTKDQIRAALGHPVGAGAVFDARLVEDGLDRLWRALKVRAEVFRAVLTASFGARAIKSTRFEVEQNRETIVFTGTGHGHGVGACQAGAMARARAGHDPARILTHYYPGTRLDRLTVSRRRGAHGATAD